MSDTILVTGGAGQSAARPILPWQKPASGASSFSPPARPMATRAACCWTRGHRGGPDRSPAFRSGCRASSRFCTVFRCFGSDRQPEACMKRFGPGPVAAFAVDGLFRSRAQGFAAIAAERQAALSVASAKESPNAAGSKDALARASKASKTSVGFTGSLKCASVEATLHATQRVAQSLIPAAPVRARTDRPRGPHGPCRRRCAGTFYPP